MQQRFSIGVMRKVRGHLRDLEIWICVPTGKPQNKYEYVSVYSKTIPTEITKPIPPFDIKDWDFKMNCEL